MGKGPEKKAERLDTKGKNPEPAAWFVFRQGPLPSLVILGLIT